MLDARNCLGRDPPDHAESFCVLIKLDDWLVAFDVSKD